MRPNVTIYRLENDAGYGPFVSNAAYSLGTVYAFWQSPEFPNPYFDSQHLMQADHFCGCSSIPQLLEWFPTPVLAALARKEFKVAVYQTKRNVWVLKRQVVFCKADATFLHYLKRADLKAMEVGCGA